MERTYAIELLDPPRRGFISREAESGWRVVLEQDGMAEPLRSTWEEFFFEILRYPPLFGFPLGGWRQEWDGAIVDLAALQPFIDGKPAGPDDTPEEVGLR